MNLQSENDIELVSTYIEDGLLNLLIAPADVTSPLRWYVRVRPRSRRIVDCWLMRSEATVDELPYSPTPAVLAHSRRTRPLPPYSPTPAELAIFRRLAKSA